MLTKQKYFVIYYGNDIKSIAAHPNWFIVIIEMEVGHRFHDEASCTEIGSMVIVPSTTKLLK